MERYVQQGRISVRYEKSKTRPTANFDSAELETFKTELNQPSYKPAVQSRQNTSNSESHLRWCYADRQITTEVQSEADKVIVYPGEIGDDRICSPKSNKAQEALGTTKY